MTLKVAVVLPRNSYFGPSGATAVDLCAADFIRFSRYCSDTTVFCHPADPAFDAFDIRFVPRAGTHASIGRQFAKAVRSARADIVVVHQHVQTAVSIARAFGHSGAPVILHRHANPKAPKSKFGLWRERRRYRKFARTIWPSKASMEPFILRQPALSEDMVVVHNGIDLSAWRPATVRESDVVFIGRAHMEKGGLEAAIGVTEALLPRPEWRARFILSRSQGPEAITAEIKAALAPLGERAQVEADVPFAEAKAALESAAIALTPSNYHEAFGRTALEAMAGGAALIHSGRAGLAEVVGDAGVELPEVTAGAVRDAVSTLVDDPARRARISNAGLERARRFDIRQSAARLDSLYEAVIRERAKRS